MPSIELVLTTYAETHSTLYCRTEKICQTITTCERSRARATIRPTLKTVHLQLSALPLATRLLATARPCHAHPTQQPSVSPATQRPTSPNSASGGHEKPRPGKARALPRKVENRKKMQIPRSSWRTTGVPLWCVLPYCCVAVVDWSVRTASLLLYCWVVVWSVGGWWMVGAWWVTARALCRKVENRKKVQIPSSSWRTTGVPLWCVLPYYCVAVVDWSVPTAPLLLYCCGGVLASGWVMGAGCLVGDGSRSPPEGGES